MAGICGWLDTDSNLSPAQQQALTTQMGQQLSAARSMGNAVQTSAANRTAGALHVDHGDTAVIEGLVITISGRPYWSDAALAELATRTGHAAAIAQAWKQHRVEFLQKLHGVFSVAVLDPSTNTALVAIDRIGTVPLAYHCHAQGLAFGASASAVSRHPAVTRQIAPQSVFDYLYFHMVPSPRTIYTGISKLLPGQYLLFANGKLNTEFYWRLKYEDHNGASQEALEQEFHPLLRDAVRRQIGDGEIGAFLSGGTDSSTTSGILTEVLGRPARTYSIGFEAEGFDETEFARITAKHFGTDHKAVYITPQDVVEAIPKIAAAYDEPFGNASAVPTYFCARVAKEDGIDIMIAGDGGDEIFAGNERYAKQGVFEHYYRVPAPLRSALLEPMSRLLPDAVMPLRKIKSYIAQAKIPLPARLETYNFLHREALDNIFTADFLSSIDAADPQTICRDAYHRTDANHILNKMMHLDLKNTLADNDLRKVNRMCQLAGIDVRYPLLDEALVEFSGRVPVELKIKDGRLRYFFKHALRDFLAPDTITKSKHGFGLPFGLWMQEYAPLRELANDSLQGFAQRNIIQPSYIELLQNKHHSEHASYYGVMIWVIMMLEQWLQSHE